MPHVVMLTADAERDLSDIFRYISRQDGPAQAGAVLDRLEAAVRSLSSLPGRGNFPPELERIGVRAFREIHEVPWRILYQVHGRKVFVLCILDARRDVQAQLQERMLR
ncbi:MAG: plasmid stabilization protein [Desulfovibrionales bacterium GWA2_65_9]|nr:MAG: plasmid stabilization protein [Desulfovibrionales bacterium GWA2_65_9]